jgi:hypothetical protein
MLLTTSLHHTSGICNHPVGGQEGQLSATLGLSPSPTMLYTLRVAMNDGDSTWEIGETFKLPYQFRLKGNKLQTILW